MKILIRLNIIFFICLIVSACGGGSDAACSLAIGALTCASSGSNSSSGINNKSSDITSPSETYKVYQIVNGDGSSPQASVIEVNGTFYGTTQSGGSFGYGTIFSMDALGNVSTIYSFKGSTDVNGSIPFSGLTKGSDGNVYGLTTNGGAGYGVLFQLDTINNIVVPKHSFDGSNEGAHPQGNLLLGTDGNLYGTAVNGGSFGSGTIFRINFIGGNLSDFERMYSFTSSDQSTHINYDGANPLSGLVQDSNGVLYGTTSSGGSSGNGTVYSFDPNTRNLNPLYSFLDNSSDGLAPYATLLLVGNNTLYGTTSKGGRENCKCGTVFSLQTSGAPSSYKTLYSFKGGSDGDTPYGNLVYINEILYGTTNAGGTNNLGTIYSIKTDGTDEKIVHSFGTINNDGSQPYAGLMLGSDGYYYGTTEKGGNNSTGTVYKFYP
jgi:uncharacterized repeat protein (TIGR03803 family)